MNAAIDRPLEQRVNDAYQEARRRQGVPIGHIEAVYMALRHRLAAITGNPGLAFAPSDPRYIQDPAGERRKALEAALAEFEKWIGMPSLQIPAAIAALAGPAPAPDHHAAARARLVDFRRRGISISADAEGRLTVLPAAKLTEEDKRILVATKRYIAAELMRDVFVV